LLVFPAGLMALLLAALNAMGEGLRSAFEPRDED
jgi:ABC-type dipeptide/oligopeptide/nickel transport system permease subunit